MSGKHSSDSRQELEREILRYQVAHPDAKDTAEGILKWWLPTDLDDRRQSAVQEALDALVSAGLLTKRVIVPPKEIYAMNKERLEDIKAILDQLDDTPTREKAEIKRG